MTVAEMVGWMAGAAFVVLSLGFVGVVLYNVLWRYR